MQVSREVFNETLIKWLLKTKVLRFGDFTLKSGRRSNYFFNMGKVFKTEDLGNMAHAYIQTMTDLIDLKGNVVIFGPAYKGIPLSVAVSTYWETDTYTDTQLEYSFDRKEEKTHGDGGKLVGAPLEGKDVIIIDDVITSGGSILEAAEIVAANGGNLIGIVVFVDRAEDVTPEVAGVDCVINVRARDFLETKLHVPVLSVLDIAEIVNSKVAQEQYKEECQEIIKTLTK